MLNADDFPIMFLAFFLILIFVLCMLFIEQKQVEYQLNKATDCVLLIEKSSKITDPDILKMIETIKESHCKQ